MNILTIIAIAIGLSMDSFAVSITNGLTIKDLNQKKIFSIAFSLAIFQGLMPLFGWFLGSGYEKYITQIDHWIAFILLSFIGVKMIYESINKKNNYEKSNLTFSILIGQSFATSIDAFAIGITFAFLDAPIIYPVLIIGSITFIISLFGLLVGKYFGKNQGKYAEIFGGIVLIGIGTKILIEHLYFS